MSDIDPSALDKPIDQLLYLVARLRDPKDGCPWDLKQSYQSLVPYTLEEAHEVADAVDSNDPEQIKDELGDLLLQVVLYAQIAKDQQHFDFDAVVATIVAKMLRRHPHVFPDGSLASRAGEFKQANKDVVHEGVPLNSQDEQSEISTIKANWESIKQTEQLAAGKLRSSTIDGIPAGFPSILKAQKLQKKAAKYGFDWPSASGAMAKLIEELEELKEAFEPISTSANDKRETSLVTDSQKADIADELGDLMFSCVNLSRLLDLDADAVLRAANRKFEQRYRLMEQLILEQADKGVEHDAAAGQEDFELKSEETAKASKQAGGHKSTEVLAAASLEEMEAAWLEAKRRLQASS